jgi:hypothetical protein
MGYFMIDPAVSRYLTVIASAIVLTGALSFTEASDTSNTITRDDFNFGHQLGYMYARMDDAYFKDDGTGIFTTGFLTFYTPVMPMVRNAYWKKRTILMIPLYFEYFPCSRISLQAEVTDLFIEFPYQSIENMGGKSPRFKTKIKLLGEHGRLPALAFTVGVKFSSAKPYTIWNNNHNYDESNGLAGAGTGVADYLLLFTASRHIRPDVTIHARLGLVPLGSPVEYTRGSAQADEIPYGIAVKKELTGPWALQAEVCGMYNGLKSTRLAHYSVARIKGIWQRGPFELTIDAERGLTEETDTWVAGVYVQRSVGKKSGR